MNDTYQRAPLVLVPKRWPFHDPPNVAVFTSTHIINKGFPVLFVSHDSDGAWQFHWGGYVSEEEAMIISLKEAFEHDVTIGLLNDLPCGWSASRDSQGGKWVRNKKKEESSDCQDT
jgi:hypothetical protein